MRASSGRGTWRLDLVLSERPERLAMRCRFAAKGGARARTRRACPYHARLSYRRGARGWPLLFLGIRAALRRMSLIGERHRSVGRELHQGAGALQLGVLD